MTDIASFITEELGRDHSRTELIAAFKRHKFAFPPKPAETPVAPTISKTPASADSTTDTAPTSDSVDATITQQIAELEKLMEAIDATQKTDPDAGTDPADKKVEGLLEQIGSLVTELKTAQAADVDPSTTTETDAPAKPAVAAPDKLAVVNKDPSISPVDEKGNVAPEATCATDGCGHLASAHENLDSGENSGPCSMQNCDCTMFADVNTGMNQPTGDAGDGGGPNNAGGDDSAPATGSSVHASRGGFAAGDSPGAASDAGLAPEGDEAGGYVPGDDEVDLPLIPGGMNSGPAFTIPVAIVEGKPTDDGRAIAPSALEWINEPWALMGLATATHDPMGFDPNDPAVICGFIRSFERQSGPNGTQVIVGQGNFLTNDDGAYFADLLEQAGRLPVSADIMVLSQQITADEFDEWGDPVDALMTCTSGRIEAVTILPFGPAFSDCYIVLGDGEEKTEIPQQTDNQQPAAMAASAQHWILEEPCEPCESGMDVLTAAGGPVRPPSAWFEDPKFASGDGRVVTMIGKDKYGHMKRHEGVPIHVTDDGEVFGHIAQWGICHIGLRGECIVAPHSKLDYAYFKRGQHLITAEGDTVRVGKLTVDTTHADLGLGRARTEDHYDDTGLQVADVNIGEDAFGIWVHGAIRPEATEAQIQKLRSSSQSGDWREEGGNLELVASLTVSTPGFVQAVVAGGGRGALVAAGAMGIHVLRGTDETVVGESAESVFKSLRRPLARFIRLDAKRSIDPLRRRIAQDKISQLTRVGK